MGTFGKGNSRAQDRSSASERLDAKTGMDLCLQFMNARRWRDLHASSRLPMQASRWATRWRSMAVSGPYVFGRRIGVSTALAQRLDQERKGRRRLAATGIVKVIASEHRTPVCQGPLQLAFGHVRLSEPLRHVGKAQTG